MLIRLGQRRAAMLREEEPATTQEETNIIHLKVVDTGKKIKVEEDPK
jgi:hypothetical protein